MSIEMYTKPTCPYCIRALWLLKKKGVEPTLYNLYDQSSYRNEMIARTGGHTVPQIIIHDQPIGGCDDLMVLDASGELDQKLQGVKK